MIFRNEFLEISFLPNIATLCISWKPTSQFMTDEQFRESVQLENEAILHHRPRRVLGNTSSLLYGIPPALQDWHNALMFPSFKRVGVERLAVVMSKDFFAQVSVEQLFDEGRIQTFITRYFDNEMTALEWLGKDV